MRTVQTGKFNQSPDWIPLKELGENCDWAILFFANWINDQNTLRETLLVLRI